MSMPKLPVKLLVYVGNGNWKFEASYATKTNAEDAIDKIVGSARRNNLEMPEFRIMVDA